MRRTRTTELCTLGGRSECTAGHGDAVHEPARTVIVVHRIVPGGAIVPEGDRALAPAEARDELRLDGMTIKFLQKRPASLDGPAFEAHGEGRVDIEHPGSAQRMANHRGMDDLGTDKMR